MRVLHFYKRCLPESNGGIEQVIHEICLNTQGEAIENVVLGLTTGDKVSQFDLGYDVVLQNEWCEISSTPLSLSVIWRFFKMLKTADLVHFHYPYPIADILSLMCLRTPYIVTYHSDIVKQRLLSKLIYPIEWLFLFRAKAIVSTSPNYTKTSRFLQLFQSKTRIIPLGVSVDQLNFEKKALVEFKELTNGQPFFLFIGHNRYYKGLHILIKALKMAPEIRVIVAGENHKNVHLDAIKHKLKNIEFVGKVSDQQKAALLYLSYAFIFPSHLRSEAFGVSLVEASFSGKPMISCEIGTGTSFVNIDGETGIVVPPSSPTDLVNAMRKLLRDPELARSFGESARRRAHKLFNAKDQGVAYAALYTEVLRKPKR